MKSYTDLSQSKKLAEILPIKNADMCYLSDESLFPKINYNGMVFFNSEEEKPSTIIPCWSLDALLEAMPKYIRKYDGRVYRNYSLNLYRSYYHCCGYSFGSTTTDDDDNTLYCIGRDNWVDACYEMILKLHEQKLL